MLTRTYRLTDKLGTAALKTLALVFDWTLEGIAALVRTIVTGLLVIWGILWLILRPIARILGAVGLFILNLFLRLLGQSAVTVRQSAGDAMARRAARREIDALIVEDPLKRQNRVLSALTVVLLVALIGAILWATNPARSTAPPPPASLPVNVAAFQEPGAAASTIVPTPGMIVATPVPTAIPAAANALSGSIAYTAREAGQTDLWVLSLTGRQPIRITNDPADERDPAWSPDGRRLAYASRQDGNWEIYIADLVSGTNQRMTFDLSFQANPDWSPDGEWLVYESYQGDNLDIYVLRVDGSQPPIRLPGSSDAPDFSPAWSPDGRRIAFVSLRTGNAEIFTFNLDDSTLTNVTNTPGIQEDHPAWQPTLGADAADRIAYSALDGGAEKVFVRSTVRLTEPAQVIAFGRAPSWSPPALEGSSLVFTLESNGVGQLTIFPYSGAPLGLPIISVPPSSYQPVWTDTPLPTALINRGSLPPPVDGPLFIEQVAQRSSDPPIALQPLPGVRVDNAALADTVNDSFNALRERVVEAAGWDFLGRLDDAFWPLDRLPQPGEERRSWLMTGRAFAITRNSIVGFPPPLEVVREDIGVDTRWRLFLRVSEDAQRGELGEPLRQIPWDFAARTSGDVEAYDQGGRLRPIVPAGYYVDFTQLAADYDWTRVPAGSDWRANANTIYYWLFEQRGGLTWYEAMRQIYPAGQLVNFEPTALPAFLPATPGAAPTLPVSSPQPVPSATPAPDGLLPGAEALLTPQALPDSP
jgi:TolB protein